MGSRDQQVELNSVHRFEKLKSQRAIQAPAHRSNLNSLACIAQKSLRICERCRLLSNCLRSGSRVVMVSPMKGYLAFAAGLLAFCTAMFLTACAEDSGWSTGFGGVQLQQDGRASAPAGELPPGSGAVDDVPQGPF
jgi:hypothetical protein